MNDIQLTAKIFAPDIEPKYRHPKIFQTFDALDVGEYIELTNDHDPKPIQYQLMMEREGSFTWEYVQEGPKLWTVIIGKK